MSTGTIDIRINSGPPLHPSLLRALETTQTGKGRGCNRGREFFNTLRQAAR